MNKPKQSPLALALNKTLEGSVALKLFSTLGLNMYFPKGIIAQGAEAKERAYFSNATIGTTIINKTPAILPSIQKCVPALTPKELVSYSPTAGLLAIRKAWQEKQLLKNPSLKDKSTSLPIVVPGLTAGLSYTADLFIDTDKPLIASSPSWDNYSLITEARRSSPFHTFKMFTTKDTATKDTCYKFNIQGIRQAIQEDAKEYGSARLILNFPQNPSGYSPTTEEVKELCAILKDFSDKGIPLLVICDDAYFGLNYEENIEAQSIFTHICDLSPNLLAVKVDGPTKEDFAWGFRCGFLTYGSKGMNESQYDALIKKTMGVIRSSVSCSATPSQSIILRSFMDENNDNEKKEFRAVLKERFDKVKSFTSSNSNSFISPYPFNSGYFMSFALQGIDAEKLRLKLLKDYGVGTISIDDKTLRVAFSSIETKDIDKVFDAIYKAAESLGESK